VNPRDRRQRGRASERTILHANSFLSDNASFPRLARLAGGAGSARPRERYWLHPGISPLGYRAILNGCGGNEMSRSMCSLATRTHGVRPSEKTGLRLVSGFSTQGDPLCAWHPLEGRAPHAGSDGIGLAGACPIWPPGVRFPPMIMLCLGMSKALPRGRGDRAPPRKSPSASAPGFPREAILAWIAPAEGRAPHARKRSHHANRNIATFWPRPFADPRVTMRCPGLLPARIFARAERIPPRKPASALSPGFPRKATHFALGTPWRGGLRTPPRPQK